MAQLNNANLRRAKLNHADLELARLNYSSLREADLNYADLAGANLNRVDLSYSNLKNVSFGTLLGSNIPEKGEGGENLCQAKTLAYAQMDDWLFKKLKTIKACNGKLKGVNTSPPVITPDMD